MLSNSIIEFDVFIYRCPEFTLTSILVPIQFFLFERGKECFRNSIELPCFVLCVMIKADEAEGMSALLDDDW